MSNEKERGRIAVYAGTFDPLTNGHLNIARRAAKIFDTLIVAVYAFPSKNLLFSVDERVVLWQQAIEQEKIPNVRIDKFTELTVDYVRSVGGQAIIKGLRSPADFESEFQQGLMNHTLAPEIETVCLFTNLEQLYVSSSLIKEVARLGGNITNMVPTIVAHALHEKFGM